MQLILNIKTLPPWTAAHSVCRSMFFDCCMLVTSFHYIDENWDIQSSEFIFPLLDLIKLCQALLTVSSAMSSHWCVVGRMIKNSIKGWSLSASLADRWFQFSSGFRDIPIGSHSHVNLFFCKSYDNFDSDNNKLDYIGLTLVWSVGWFWPREKCLLTEEEIPAGVDCNKQALGRWGGEEVSHHSWVTKGRHFRPAQERGWRKLDQGSLNEWLLGSF